LNKRGLRFAFSQTEERRGFQRLRRASLQSATSVTSTETEPPRHETTLHPMFDSIAENIIIALLPKKKKKKKKKMKGLTLLCYLKRRRKRRG